MGTLVGRTAEADALAAVLAAVRDGLSGVLVLHGEAGIGKTALLDWASRQADGVRATRVAAVESERDLGYAALHRLLVPFLDGLERLPGPQRAALEAAFGLTAGSAPDRFLVGLATLTLITSAADARPVLCVVDDAQWLDRASADAFGFAARRLFAEPVGMLFAVREGEERAAAFEGLPELAVGGLPEGSARELIAASAGGPVDPRVRERIVAEAAGNPLALVEFAGELTTGELSGAEPLREPLRFGGRLQELYLSRTQALPADAQTLLLVAAADQLGDPGKVWRAAGQLGIGPETAAPQGLERLMSWTPRVRFRQPLVRSAVYYGATPAARRRVHAALAAVSDPERDPDRRAWHLAQGVSGPDELVAAALERSADRARGRGGWAGGASFLERAADLTPAPRRRARRLLAAAEARLMTGGAAAARALLDRAASDPDDPLAEARARQLRGGIAFTAGELAEAPAALLDAARMLEPHDARLARDALLEAFGAAQVTGQFGAGTAEVLRTVRPAPGRRRAPGDLLLDGFAAIGERRHSDGVRLLRRAVAPLTGGQLFPGDAPQRLLAFNLAVAELYDDATWHELADRWVAQARDRGALAATAVGLGFLAYSQLAEGRLAEAEATIAEGRALSAAMGNRTCADGLATAELEALAWRGRKVDVRPLAARLLRDLTDQGSGLGVLRVHKALAGLELGLGNYADALRHALQTVADQPLLAYESAPEIVIEAAARCGDRATATAALEEFGPRWVACGTPWALGLLARSRALVADGVDAEEPYREAVEHLRQCRVGPQLARTCLLYGEWLRRQRRRRDARDQLSTASQMFDAFSMRGFAERARAELRATGEHAARRRPGTPEALTPQETHIARLAAEGATNAEIAARLFISVSTVEYHLHKVFRKLGITGRVRLAHVSATRLEEPGIDR